MEIRRVVIRPTEATGTFGRFLMPDGSEALVMDRDVHRRALQAAGKKLDRIMRTNRLKARAGGQAA